MAFCFAARTHKNVPFRIIFLLCFYSWNIKCKQMSYRRKRRRHTPPPISDLISTTYACCCDWARVCASTEYEYERLIITNWRRPTMLPYVQRTSLLCAYSCLVFIFSCHVDIGIDTFSHRYGRFQQLLHENQNMSANTIFIYKEEEINRGQWCVVMWQGHRIDSLSSTLTHLYIYKYAIRNLNLNFISNSWNIWLFPTVFSSP